MEGTYLCGFTFFANFDSGNLARIEVDEEYRENNGHLDCKKMLKKFLENVREIVMEFSEDEDLLADMKIVGLTTEWTPCTGKETIDRYLVSKI